jgi:hypothetical protein
VLKSLQCNRLFESGVQWETDSFVFIFNSWLLQTETPSNGALPLAGWQINALQFKSHHQGSPRFVGRGPKTANT